MDVKKLKQFLYERKMKLLTTEKIAKGKARASVIAQIQVLDVVLTFLSTEQGDEDMAKLTLSLERHAKSLDELEPRTRNSELGDSLKELAKELKPGTFIPINGPDAKNLKPKSIVAKVHALKEMGELPKDITTAVRKQNVYLVYKDGK